MKYPKTMIPVFSLLALVACGEGDKKHTYTVEVEVKDLKGKVQTFKNECPQLKGNCSVSFKLDTPFGSNNFSVRAINKPLNEEKIYEKMRATESEEEAMKIIDVEYKQTVTLYGGTGFKAKVIDAENWKPQEKKIVESELIIPNLENINKAKAIEEKVKKLRKNLFSGEVGVTIGKINVLMAKQSSILKTKAPDIKVGNLTIRIY